MTTPVLTPAPSRELPIGLKRVSRSVTGRRHRRGRVRYDSRRGDAIPEEIVRRRCRSAGFQSFRLRPSIWRAMASVQHLEDRHPEGSIEALLERLPKRERPRADLVNLLRALPQRRLQALMRRHTSGDVNPRKPGVPDLVVYKTTPDGRPFAFRFVEVKRPNERLLPHQSAEIRFMRSIGMRAGVFRLKEVSHP